MAPKVRPRPRARQNDVEVDIASSGSGSGTPARASTSKSTTPTRNPASQVQFHADRDHDDDLFMRSNGAMWKRNFIKSAKRSRKETSPSGNKSGREGEDESRNKNDIIDLSSSSEHSFTDEDSDAAPASSSPVYGENEDGSMPERPRRRPKRSKRIKQHPLPEWTNPKIQAQKRQAEEGMRGNNEASNTINQRRDQEQGDNEDSYGYTGAQIEQDGKNGRESSQVELTPPPSLPPASVSRTIPTLYEQDEDETAFMAETVNLNPTLLAIRENMKTNPAPQTASAAIGPEIIDIKCKIIIYTSTTRDREEELNPALLSELNKSFRYRRADSFEALFRYLAQRDVLNTQPDGVVMTYEGHRVFTGATPASLNMLDKADMEAMTSSTYDHLKEKRRLQYMDQVARARLEEEERQHRIEQEQKAEDSGGSSDVEFVGATQRPAQQQNLQRPPNAPPSPVRIRLTLRGMNRNEEYKIQIPVERKCSILLSSYLSYFNIDHSHASSYKLEFDGDRLDLNRMIQDTDLEDEDLLNVIKLNQ